MKVIVPWLPRRSFVPSVSCVGPTQTRSGLAALLVLALGMGSLAAQVSTETADAADRMTTTTEALDTSATSTAQHFLLPYGFYSDLFNAAGGFAYGVSDWPHKGAAVVGTAIGGSNGSIAGFLIASNLNVPSHKRLLTDVLISAGHFGNQRMYVPGNVRYPDERAGSHGSDEDNYVDGDGDDTHFRLRFKYILPLGSGRDQPLPNYVLDRGILVANPSGGERWNPLRSGRTFLELEPFYRTQEVDADDEDEIDLRTNGIKLALTYDNTDFPLNPSYGSFQRIAVVRDFGWFDSYNDWTALEGEWRKYFNLGPTEKFRQRVVAFNAWTAYSVTWDEEDTEFGPVVTKRPPSFEGARLGGTFRMRGYPSARFSDQAALFYGLEYRVIPEDNPLDHVPVLRDLDTDWMQWVVFTEAGRVAEDWNLSTLHSDLNWDFGVGVRVFLKKILVRLDLAVSEEGGGVQAMVNHPF